MSCEIQVFCEINPSEDPSKIKTAVLNIFPDLDISLNDEQLVGQSNHIDSLANFSKSIHAKNTRATLQRFLEKNISGNSTWFYINKQAAFVDKVALCNESDESPLGPIKVILESKDIKTTIQSLS